MVGHHQSARPAGCLAAELQGRQGQPDLAEPQQRAVYGKDACVRSFYDYEAYYFDLMARNTGAGGCWWDWGSLAEGRSLDKGTMYLNDEGVAEPRTRHLFLLPRPSTSASPASSRSGRAGHEQLLRSRGCLPDALADADQRLGVHVSRIRTRRYVRRPGRGQVPQHHRQVRRHPNQAGDEHPHRPEGPPRARSWHFPAAHDNGIGASTGQAPPDLSGKAGVFDPAAEWVPNWRSQKTALADNASILISVYANEAAKRLTLVVVNPGGQDVESDIKVPGAVKAVDIETNAELPSRDGTIGKVAVKRHEWCSISVEQ